MKMREALTRGETEQQNLEPRGPCKEALLRGSRANRPWR